MSLDGLRAWIGVVERKLTMRTRVFLVLVAIAIGGAGAAIYLAIDAHDSAVSEAELQAVRDELAGSVTEAAGGDVAQLEAELRALQAEVATLRSEQSSGKEGASESAPQGSGSNGGNSPPRGANGAVAPQQQGDLTPQQQKLKELVERSTAGAGK